MSTPAMRAPRCSASGVTFTAPSFAGLRGSRLPELPEDPIRQAEQPAVAAALADELDADRHAGGTPGQRQRHCRRAEQAPHRVARRAAGIGDADAGLAERGGRYQRFVAAEDSIDEVEAGMG